MSTNSVSAAQPKTTQTTKPVEAKQKTTKPATVKQTTTKQEEPSLFTKVANRGGAIVMASPTLAAGVLTLGAYAIKGLLPGQSFDSSMTEGIQAVGQGAEMLEKMWDYKYF